MATKASGHCSASHTVPACRDFRDTTVVVLLLCFISFVFNTFDLACCGCSMSIGLPGGVGVRGCFWGPAPSPLGGPHQTNRMMLCVSRQTNPASVARAQVQACVELNLWLATIIKTKTKYPPNFCQQPDRLGEPNYNIHIFKRIYRSMISL